MKEVKSPKIPEGWFWIPGDVYAARSEAEDHVKVFYEKRERFGYEFQELKIAKRGGSKNPHWLVLHKLPETT